MASLLAGALLFLAVDVAVFRSGLYFGWVGPQSALGSVAQALANARAMPAGRPAVLVLGNSRIGEGFSAPAATAAAGRLGGDAVFASGSVGGTPARVWFYLLRRMLATAPPPSAVAVMLTSYHDNEPGAQADLRSDIAFVHPLLGLADLADFPASFGDGGARLEAAEAILFKGLFYQNDVQDFLRHPIQRAHDVVLARRYGGEWFNTYPGRAPSLAVLGFDLASGRLEIPPDREPAQVVTLAGYAERLRQTNGRPADNAPAAAYRAAWLGRIAALCRDAGVKLLVFRIPRGPLHFRADPDLEPSGVLAGMARAGALDILPAGLFAGLERPEFFYDDLHLNSAGRARFSEALAAAVVARLQAAP